jgi:urease accessory protein
MTASSLAFNGLTHNGYTRHHFVVVSLKRGDGAEGCECQMKEVLQLMQLSDSGVPIGAAAHSFGLEGLVESGGISAETLMPFVGSYFNEHGGLEACFCREGYNCGMRGENARELCFTLSALKPARESREESMVLGRRLLGMVQALIEEEKLSV